MLPQLPQIERFADALARSGFEDVSVEDISWRVAPSVMYAPYVVASFVLKKWVRRQRLSEHTRANLRGSLMCSFLGINRVKFGYYLVSARKR